MPTLADVVRRHGPGYLRRFGNRVPAEHRKVLRSIAACRTGELGSVLFACSDCGRHHLMGRSCGNRHCASCQHDKASVWLQKQADRLLPCPHFMLTFTVPAELRRFLRSHQRLGYHALFAASSSAIQRLAADPTYLGTPAPGFFGVLHTWGRTLDYHPHIHYVVPGGGPNHDGSAWLASRADFFLPVRALSKLFRAHFRRAMQHHGLLADIDPAVWNKDWVVHSLPVGDGRGCLNYLAPYVFRVAIGDHRIRSDRNGLITFSYRRSGSRRSRTMTLQAHEFLRRFLQHVLPTGFQKIRYYGFASPRARFSLDLVHWLIALHAGKPFVLRSRPSPPPAPRASCPCGGVLHVVRFICVRSRALFDTS